MIIYYICYTLMALRRYLIRFGYIGTFFRGVQKHSCKGVPIHQTETVQGLLELALQKLKHRPLNTPMIYTSSRTDAGVHALNTTAHVDLDFGKNEISPNSITRSLNLFFKTYCSNIRIHSVEAVPNTFSARHLPVRRNYLYRFAVIKPEFYQPMKNIRTIFPTPVIEQDRCHFVYKSGFDPELVHKVTPKFEGIKDFRSFMGRPKANDEIDTIREIYSLELKPGKSLFPCPISEKFVFWEVYCSGKSFLYRQVRRMVGALIAVGDHRFSGSEIDHLFDMPDRNSWNPSAEVVPACGLYLTSVEYNEEDLIVNESNEFVIENKNVEVTQSSSNEVV